MKCTAFVWLLTMPMLVFAQDFTIGGKPGSTIFIGVENVLEFTGPYKELVTQIETDRFIQINSKGDYFDLSPYKPMEQIWFRLYTGKHELVDSISLKTERISFRQFVKVQNSGLIVSGDYSKATLQNLESVIVNLNVPWIETPVVKFKIEIYQHELLFSAMQNGARLDSPGIQKAISKLTRGGTIRISQIRARLPGDDSPQPRPMTFICK